MSNTWSEVTSQ